MRTLFVTFQIVIMSSLLGIGVFASVNSPQTIHEKASRKNSVNKTHSRKNESIKQASNSNLKTDIRFDESTIRGLRQRPLGASTEVESEKNIPNLIDYRANFNDRIKKSEAGSL